MKLVPKGIPRGQADSIQRDLLIVVVAGLFLALTLVSLGVLVIGQF